MSAVRQCPKCSRRRCFICGSKKDLQEHHLGGRNHARFSTITLCRIHHEPVSILIARAKINPDFTSDMVERARRARQRTPLAPLASARAPAPGFKFCDGGEGAFCRRHTLPPHHVDPTFSRL
jgi:hypothetical protein